MKICILGDGGWGTTLAILLAHKGHKVTLWGAFPGYAAFLDKKRVNKRFLPGIRIPKAVRITGNLQEAVSDKQLIVIAVPAQYVRGVLSRIKRNKFHSRAIFLSASKGIEVGTLLRVSEIARCELGPKVKFAVLSGPTIAHEVALGVPTVAVVASASASVRGLLQNILITERFRIYTNSDVAGVELGGSLKNVIAIACGVSDGLGFGTNTKAALLSRGLAEIARLGVIMGAKARTFSGISGLGDLVTTCISPFSRNRSVGEQIGRGKKLRSIQSHMRMVAEGVSTAKSAYALSKKYNVDMPIVREAYRILYRKKPPLLALQDLMARKKREE